jgi:hypothetical protein
VHSGLSNSTLYRLSGSGHRAPVLAWRLLLGVSASPIPEVTALCDFPRIPVTSSDEFLKWEFLGQRQRLWSLGSNSCHLLCVGGVFTGGVRCVWGCGGV